MGGDGGFDAFYESYYVRVKRFAARKFGAADAEDIAQEAMCRAYREFETGRLDLEREPWPWIATVTNNVGIDLVRLRARSVPVPMETIETMMPPSPDATVNEVLSRDTRRAFGRAWRRLPEGEQCLLRMREFEEVPVPLIAAHLGSTANAARQSLFRARKHLAREYRAVLEGRAPMSALPSSVAAAFRDGVGTVLSHLGAVPDTAAALAFAAVAGVGVGAAAPAVAAAPLRPAAAVVVSDGTQGGDFVSALLRRVASLPGDERGTTGRDGYSVRLSLPPVPVPPPPLPPRPLVVSVSVFRASHGRTDCEGGRDIGANVGGVVEVSGSSECLRP